MTEFKSVFHLYFGCDCDVPGKMVATFVGVIYRDGGWWPQVQEFKNNIPKGTSYTVNWDVIKPILRKTDDLNYAELLGFAQSDNYYVFSSYDEAVQTAKNIIQSNQFRPQAIQWLLSRHIDILGLIESGQAIDAKTLTQ